MLPNKKLVVTGINGQGLTQLMGRLTRSREQPPITTLRIIVPNGLVFGIEQKEMVLDRNTL